MPHVCRCAPSVRGLSPRAGRAENPLPAARTIRHSPERLRERAPFTRAMKRPDQQAGMQEAIRPDRHDHEPVKAGGREGEETQEENRAAHPERYPCPPKRQPTLLIIRDGREMAAGEVTRPGSRYGNRDHQRQRRPDHKFKVPGGGLPGQDRSEGRTHCVQSAGRLRYLASGRRRRRHRQQHWPQGSQISHGFDGQAAARSGGLRLCGACVTRAHARARSDRGAGATSPVYRTSIGAGGPPAPNARGAPAAGAPMAGATGAGVTTNAVLAELPCSHLLVTTAATCRLAPANAGVRGAAGVQAARGAGHDADRRRVVSPPGSPAPA
jgi:hypothetical protein